MTSFPPNSCVLVIKVWSFMNPEMANPIMCYHWGTDITVWSSDDSTWWSHTGNEVRKPVVSSLLYLYHFIEHSCVWRWHFTLDNWMMSTLEWDPKCFKGFHILVVHFPAPLEFVTTPRITVWSIDSLNIGLLNQEMVLSDVRLIAYQYGILNWYMHVWPNFLDPLKSKPLLL